MGADIRVEVNVKEVEHILYQFVFDNVEKSRKYYGHFYGKVTYKRVSNSDFDIMITFDSIKDVLEACNINHTFVEDKVNNDEIDYDEYMEMLIDLLPETLEEADLYLTDVTCMVELYL